MKDLSDCLNELGSHEFAVAFTLEALGIKGAKFFLCDCPIAKYLIKLGFIGVSVSTVRAKTDQQQCFLPEPVADFILHFDDGEYPELETTDESFLAKEVFT